MPQDARAGPSMNGGVDHSIGLEGSGRPASSSATAFGSPLSTSEQHPKPRCEANLRNSCLPSDAEASEKVAQAPMMYRSATHGRLYVTARWILRLFGASHCAKLSARRCRCQELMTTEALWIKGYVTDASWDEGMVEQSWPRSLASQAGSQHWLQSSLHSHTRGTSTMVEPNDL